MLKFNLPQVKWSYVFIGGAVGLFYVVLDEGILDYIHDTSPFIVITHEFVDAILPVLLGIAAGIIIGFFQKQLRINRSLSINKEKLEKELLLSMLISQMLHEIQNPLHNISAAFENAQESMTGEKYEIIRRNLERLNELKKKYGHWEWESRFNPEEPLLFKPWIKIWVEDNISPQLKSLDIHVALEIKDLRLFVHSILIEQIFMTIFENAFEAMENTDKKKLLCVDARIVSGEGVRIRVSSNGKPFPEDVLKIQGSRPVQSRHGLGLGLLLLNKILEQIGGKMTLSNEADRSVVTLLLPGESA
jgi:signal transduction histidine kinase